MIDYYLFVQTTKPSLLENVQYKFLEVREVNLVSMASECIFSN